MKNEQIYLKFLSGGHQKSDETEPFGPIIRDCYIIHYIVSGSGYFECNGRTFHLNKGDSFLITPGLLTRYYPDKDDPWEYIWVNFSGLEAKNLLALTNMSEKNPIAVKGEASPLECFLKLKKYNNDFSPAAQCISNGILHQLLGHFITNYPAKNNTSKSDIIDIAISYIEMNYHKHNLDIDTLADAISINRVTLYRHFKKHLKMSPKQYIADIRLKRAYELLSKKQLAIKTIAFSLGFDDQLYFSKFFKSHTGISPLQYRNSISD